jgi:putative membrane protein
MLRIVLAVLHLAALGIGLGAVWARARALSARPLDGAAARRAFAADGWWGAAAGLWIATGLWRLIAGTEKATGYYLANHVFYAKMGFFALILALELFPMITLIRWRRAAGREGTAWSPDTRAASRISAISYAQAVLVLAMVTAAVMMARGYGARGGG